MHTDDFGRCQICSLIAGECQHDFRARCWEHGVSFATCWADGFRCNPPKVGEKKRVVYAELGLTAEPELPVDDEVDLLSPEDDEALKLREVEKLMRATRSREKLVARWVSRDWSGSIYLDEQNGCCHCRPVRWRDEQPGHVYRASGLEELIAKIKMTPKFARSFRLLKEGEAMEQPAVVLGRPKIVNQKLILKLRAASLNGREIMELTGVSRTAVYTLLRSKAGKKAADASKVVAPHERLEDISAAAASKPVTQPARGLDEPPHCSRAAQRRRERREQLFGTATNAPAAEGESAL